MMNEEENTSERGLMKLKAWHLTVLRLLVGAVGLVLIAAAVLKAMEMEAFIRQIKDHGIITHGLLLTWNAWGLIALECILGVGLVVFYRPRLIFPSTAVLLLTFMGVTGRVWMTGSTANCGCFGSWLERTPGEAMLENLVLLTVTVLGWLGHRRLQVPQTRAKTWAIAAACLVGVILPVVFGFPVSRIIQTPPDTGLMEIDHSQIQGLDQIHLKHGTYLIILMDTECRHCQEAVEDFNTLAGEADLPTVFALSMNGQSERERFMEEFQPHFPVGQINEETFWRLLGDGDIPRTMLVRDMRVYEVWDLSVPDKEVIKAACDTKLETCT